MTACLSRQWLCGGCVVRAFSLFLLLTASSAYAADAPGVARFAYAGSLVLNSAPAVVTERTSSGVTIAKGRRTERRLLQFVAAEELLPQAPTVSGSTASASATPQRATEPAIERVAAVYIEAVANDVRVETVRPSKPAEQRVAALPEPMHMLPPQPPAQIEAREAEPEAEPDDKAEAEPAQRRAQRTARRPARYYKSSQTAKNVGNPVPHWAQRMFDNVWQRHAFSYQ